MEIKIKGITKSWVMNIFIVVVFIVLAFEIAIGFIIQNYYYTSVTVQMTSLATKYGYRPDLAVDADFFAEARNLTENFEEKDKAIAEMQVLDEYGNVVLSNSGFLPDYTSLPVDYLSAVAAFDKGDKELPKPYIGRNNYSERVIAQTIIIKNSDKRRLGAVRFVIGLSDIDSHVRTNVVVIMLVGVGLVFFIFASGMYFVQSIIKPVQAVNSIARRIALGDFNSRIEVHKANEIGELCDTINYMAGELAAAETIKNDFISSVSHELRTPLTAIKGWGETVRGAIGNDTVLVEKGMEVIIGESERLSGLVEELLDFSRMQSGRLSFNMQRIDILAELEEAVYMYEESARRAGVSLKYTAPEIVLPVYGDAARLKQVFINVIDNAIKYSKQDGNVEIEVAEDEGCVRVTVKDDGVGIPAADVDRVKEKFYKANKTVRGSGIGLAVADEIIKQHNGLLLLESRENEGTSVIIVLPTEPPAVRPAPAAAEEGMAASGETDPNVERTSEQ